jgi:hypothetical protein
MYPSHFAVHVYVYDPMQTQVYHDYLYWTTTTTTTLTEFSHEFDWTIPMNASLGTYTVRATAGNCPEFSTSFQVVSATPLTTTATTPAITTPYSGGAVPGFQLESVFAGLLVGITVLMLFRRSHKQDDRNTSF